MIDREGQVMRDPLIIRFLSVYLNVFSMKRSWGYRLYLLYIVIKIILLVKICKRSIISLFGRRIVVCNSRFFLHTFSEVFIYEIYKVVFSQATPLIFDVGANIGLASLYFKLEFPDSQIVAFEPEESAFECFRQNIVTIFPEVQIYNIALGQEEGIIPFYARAGDPRSSLAPSNFNERQVKCQRLSSYISKEIDLLKIDVEGAEFEILNELGDKLLLIKEIIVEIHTKADPIIKLLRSYGFFLESYGTYNQNIDGNYFIKATRF